jgi:hypothetical protein
MERERIPFDLAVSLHSGITRLMNELEKDNLAMFIDRERSSLAILAFLTGALEYDWPPKKADEA